MSTEHGRPIRRKPTRPRENVSDLTNQLCERLGISPGYVYRIDLQSNPGTATVYCYAGQDGYCEGSKYVVTDEASPWYGQAALEPPVVYAIQL